MNELENKVRAGWKPAAIMAFTLILAACGGGGGGGSSDGVATPAPSNPTTNPPPVSGNTTTVTGSVTKGPVSGSVLELFEIDTFGQPVGAAVATGTTTVDGNFSISVPANSGTLLVVASGGSFIDESDQEPDAALKRRIQLAANESFLSLLPQGQTAVAVTPFTTALIVRGRVLGGPDGTFQAKFDAAKTALNTQAGFDLFTTVPANPVAPAATATEAEKQYALLLGGLANLINNVAIQSGASAPNYDHVVAVTFDLVDGQFDGLYFGLTDVPTNSGVPTQLPTNLDFAAEVNRFKNNNFDNYSATVVPSLEVATFGNGLPTANAGVDLSLTQSVAGQLDGSGSTDPDSGLFFSWTQTAGTPVTLSNPNIAAPTFTAPTRFLDNETLTFSLTVIDTVGFTSTDTVNVQVAGVIPSTFYAVDDDEAGDGVGDDVDGGGVVSLNSDGTGSLLDDSGTETFTYTVVGNVLTLNFATPLLVDDFDQFFDVNGDGIEEEFLVEEKADALEFTLVTDLPNGDQFIIREIGNRVFTAISSSLTKPSEPYELSDPISIFDPAQAIPFSFADGDQRTLLFNSVPNFSTLRFDDNLYHEIFSFNTNGTGTTVNNGVNFTYTIDAAGSLNVIFANGESAKYTNIITRPSGDVVAVEYTLNAPLSADDDALIGEIRLSLKKNPAAAVPATLADAAGIYSGVVADDEIPNANLDVRLNPDGTGSIDFDSIASRFFLYDFDDVIVFRSNFGVCWNLDANNNIVINRAFSLNQIPNTFSSETTPAFCAGLTDETTDFQLNLTQFDSDGTTFKHFDRRLDNRCSNVATASCGESPVLDVTDFNLRITTRVPFTAIPPVAALDSVQTPDATPILIDLLANDIARELAIDPGSVTLLRGPFFGTTSLNAANGQVTYTPNAGITQDVFQYIVRDTAGNPSQVQTVEVVINPCASINGQVGFFDRFTGDCSYSGITGAANAATSDVNLGPLPLGGVHKFDDSLFIGVDYNTNASLAAAGISSGGNGPSLNIAAGTVLAFSNSTSVVSIRRGSQINVGGTAANPVVMTSQNDIDSKRDIAAGGAGFQAYNANQQWGGLVVHGFGVTNACAYSGAVSTNDLAISGECHVISDAAQGTYGGVNNADSSGAISYLQVKHGGAAVVGGDPAAGVGLFAVGSGTAITNVEVYSTFGEGLQLIGGAANLQNYLGLYVGDSALSMDEGYKGTVSQALLIQDELKGNNCVVASGIVDASTLTSPQIEAIITQGINSRPTLSNVTCIISGADNSLNSGHGLDFSNGAFATVVDSLTVLPGTDSSTLSNYCVGVQGRSLQAAQDGNLILSSSIFACPDKTNGSVLPNSTGLEAYLVSTGNQFATLSPGTTNAAPVAAAGTGQVLLEGSPLIYSVANANLQVNGSPATVTPTGTFLGAVQQGANDWTLNWTFGLHPTARQVPLWYEAPFVVAAPFVKVSKGQTVTLDATGTVANTSGVTYQWNQVGGATVTLSSPTSISTTFTAPGAGTNLTVSGGQFDFEIVATDANGLQSKRPVRVDVGASIPEEFYSVAESIIPTAFNRPYEGGERIQIFADNTGTYRDFAGSLGFTWVDTPTTFTITINGGLFGSVFTTSEDPDGDTVFETINNTKRTDTITYTLVSDTGPKKQFTITASGATIKNKASDNTALPSVPFTNVAESNANQAVVSVEDGIAFALTSAVRNLITNVSTGVPTLLVPSVLRMDVLTFNGDGTGFAKNKNAAFTYSNDNAKLLVNFADGEIGEYTRIFNNPRGDAIGLSYTKTDNSVTSSVTPSSDAGANWVLASVPGIYATNQRVQLTNGTFVDSKSYYRLHPEGTGQLEIESFNTTTGLLESVSPNSAGICWKLDANGDLEIARTAASDQRFLGSQVPSLSTCSLVQSPDNTLITFKRTSKLLQTNGASELLTYVEERRNQCVTGASGCNNTILELTNTSLRNYSSRVNFVGNPPLAVPEASSVSGGLASPVDVLTNDLAGDSAIDPTKVTIVAGPANGTATVNPTSGEITYTSNSGYTGSDTIYYRVKDVNGNDSTIGTLVLTVL